MFIAQITFSGCNKTTVHIPDGYTIYYVPTVSAVHNKMKELYGGYWVNAPAFYHKPTKTIYVPEGCSRDILRHELLHHKIYMEYPEWDVKRHHKEIKRILFRSVVVW